jgi:MoaA/NifB/PqqE/SkfB family radical SAM enzyme
MKRAKVSMPMDLFKRIIDEAKELGCKDVHLTQYNEPMTDPLIFERLAYIREKGMTSSFYSNATLMNDEKIKKLLKDPVDLARFSIDGIKKETFESIRRGANFETVVRNVSTLYAERNKAGKTLPKIEVYFTVMDRNEDQIEEFKEFWKDKCDTVSFYPTDSRETKDLVQIDYSKLKPYPCFNPKRILVLSNGKVALCCVDIDGAVELGDLNKQSLKEILLSKKFQDIYTNQINRKCDIGMCKGCSKFYVDSAFSWWGTK